MTRKIEFAAAILIGMACGLYAGEFEFDVRPDGRYLAVPVENGAPRILLEIFEDGRLLTRDTVEWSHNATATWTGALDLGNAKGRILRFRFSGDNLPAISARDMVFSDVRFPAPIGQYSEPWRPQLHFTPPSGRLNDPNGLSYFKGEWHMFYQHSPFTLKRGAKHWGHAVSRDLLHWHDVGSALAPDSAGRMFSGSAVVDTSNTTGFGTNAHVLVYTCAGETFDLFTQRIAWSHDGRNYTKWPKAVVENRPDANRDPKVIWFAPGGYWVMLVYGEVAKSRHGISFFTSPNLKDWTWASYMSGDFFDNGHYLYECPDMFEMQIEGEGESRWIVTAANRQYAIGMFDGRSFVPEVERLEQMLPVGTISTPVYAWQTFSGVPDGRHVQIAWSKYDTLACRRKDVMFNQSMTLPMELKLVRTDEGLRLARFPVNELKALRAGQATVLKDFNGELAEVMFSCVPVADAIVALDLRGVRIEYHAIQRTLTINGHATSWKLDAKGRLGLHVFVDRVGLELFSLDGLQYIPIPNVTPNPARTDLSWKAWGMKQPIHSVTEKAWCLKSAMGGRKLAFCYRESTGDESTGDRPLHGHR